MRYCYTDKIVHDILSLVLPGVSSLIYDIIKDKLKNIEIDEKDKKTALKILELLKGEI